jgi:hypothetical protein
MKRTARLNAHRVGFCAAVLWLTFGVVASLDAQSKPNGNARDEDQRPRLTVRAQPNVGTSPARIVLSAELARGADDFEEYYCPMVVWEWGDGTVSESSSDCDPYQAGVSQIRRRYTIEHIFRRSGTYKVYFHLKQRSKIVVSGSVNVQITAGVRDFP